MQFVFGFLVALLLHMLAMHSYKKTLKMIGDKSGSESILGKWYKITPEKDE